MTSRRPSPTSEMRGVVVPIPARTGSRVRAPRPILRQTKSHSRMTPMDRQTMTRADLMKQLADRSRRPLRPDAAAADAAPRVQVSDTRELFVWFEDTSTRGTEGRRGIAGLPESLLPYAHGTRVVERRYAPGHMHLLSAVRLACRGDAADRIAALYTAALSVGTVAWIGTGARYQQTWLEMYAAAPALLPRPAAN